MLKRSLIVRVPRVVLKAGGTSAPALFLNTLFFTAGPDDEAHGLFGTITAG